MSNIKRIIKISLVLALLVIAGSWVSLTRAQNSEAYPTPPPSEQEVFLSAVMPDIVPPTAPILIAPQDNELVSTNRPQFVWLESTDNVAMSHYQLTIDGELVLDNLATPGNYELYNLSYNSSLGYYYLDIKFDLDQGQHTWKITAVDAVGLTNDSVTWSFTVDSIPPHFILTQIGDVEVSISAQDESTIPEDPIEISVNEPILEAYGEANSTVQLTAIIPGQDDYYSETLIDGRGNWSHQLPILPRDTVITLNFIIIDLARHIRVLEGVKIMIPIDVITIPLPTAVTTVEPSPTPHPDIIDPEPTKPPIIPPIEIPYKPPKEVVYEIIRWLTPTPIWRIASRDPFQTWLQFVGPWLALIILGWPTALATLLLARKFGLLISGKHLIKIWQALGVIPHEDREGWIFDSRFTQWLEKESKKIWLAETNLIDLGIPFAQVIAISQPSDPSFPPFYQTVLTDQHGLYLPLKLPLNKYRLSVQAQDYRYPTLQQRPENIKLIDFYKAEEQEVKIDRTNLSLQIPLDPVDTAEDYERGKTNWLRKIQLWLANIIVFSSPIVLVNIVLASAVILFWPSTVNLTALTLYLILGLYYLFKQRLFGNIQGLVIDKDGNFVQNALIRLIKQDGSGQTFAALTNDQGKFYYYFKSGHFKLTASKPCHKQVINTETENEVQVEGWWQQKRVVLAVSVS